MVVSCKVCGQDMNVYDIEQDDLCSKCYVYDLLAWIPKSY